MLERVAAMETFELKGVEPRPSRVAFGGYPVGGHGWGTGCERKDAERVVTAALERGITFFDTADVYGFGRSEELHAKALNSLPGSRDKVVVATKGGVSWDGLGRTRRDSSPDYLRSAAEASLRRLETDCIDLYYLHWPDGHTPLEASVDALVQLRNQGKIRAIGLSNVKPAEFQRVADAGIAAVQLRGNLLELDDVLEFQSLAIEHEVAIIAYSGLADGLLTGAIGPQTQFDDQDHRARLPLFEQANRARAVDRIEAVRQVSEAVGRSMAQVAIRWILDSGAAEAVICGTTKEHHVRNNVESSGWSLSHEDVCYLARNVPLLAGTATYDRWLQALEVGTEDSVDIDETDLRLPVSPVKT
jgi:aryl-alcohol dehydrogenase-like predicted oxidoreductase